MVYHNVLLIIFIVVSSLLYVRSDTVDHRPCEKFPSTLADDKFKRLNLIDLYNQPASMFNTKVGEECNLEYIDVKYMQVSTRNHRFPKKIPHSYINFQAGTSKEYLWIGYFGDSLLDDMFEATIERFTGYDMKYIKELDSKVTHNNHLGPRTPESIAGEPDESKAKNMEAFIRLKHKSHQDTLVCCSANNYPEGLGAQDSGECIYAVNRGKLMGFIYVFICL